MVNENIRRLLAQISELEEELGEAIQEQQETLFYRLEGTKIQFERNIREAQKKLKTGLLTWLVKSSPRNVITTPIIYSMIVPIGMLDAALSFYQLVCFPLYRVPKVKRRQYIVIDRHHLSYLNSVERLNCIYCAYANGVLAYSREIAARTEQYWCPIKHARKILDPHRRYARFADFGDAEHYSETMDMLRDAFLTEQH